VIVTPGGVEKKKKGWGKDGEKKKERWVKRKIILALKEGLIRLGLRTRGTGGGLGKEKGK